MSRVKGTNTKSGVSFSDLIMNVYPEHHSLRKENEIKIKMQQFILSISCQIQFSSLFYMYVECIFQKHFLADATELLESTIKFFWIMSLCLSLSLNFFLQDQLCSRTTLLRLVGWCLFYLHCSADPVIINEK